MNNNTDPTEKLFYWSRQSSRNPLPETLPIGFATRVLAASVRKAPQTPWWEYLALRGALASGAVAATCWLLQPQAPNVNEEAALAVSILQATLQE